MIILIFLFKYCLLPIFLFTLEFQLDIHQPSSVHLLCLILGCWYFNSSLTASSIFSLALFSSSPFHLDVLNFFTLLSSSLKLWLHSFLNLHRLYKVSGSSLKFSNLLFSPEMLKYACLNFCLLHLIHGISASILVLVFTCGTFLPLSFIRVYELWIEVKIL